MAILSNLVSSLRALRHSDLLHSPVDVDVQQASRRGPLRHLQLDGDAELQFLHTSVAAALEAVLLQQSLTSRDDALVLRIVQVDVRDSELRAFRQIGVGHHAQLPVNALNPRTRLTGVILQAHYGR